MVKRSKSRINNRRNASNWIKEYRFSILIITFVLFLFYLYAINKPSILYPSLEDRTLPVLILAIFLTIIAFFQSFIVTLCQKQPTSAFFYIITTILQNKSFQFKLSLAILLILAFSSRLWLGITFNLDLDEGQLVYDAHLQNIGYTPFIDFTTRSPILIYALILIENILGTYSILNAKILMSALYTISVMFFYLCANELFNDKNRALLSAVIYCVLPFILLYSFVLHVAQASLPFIFCFFYLFIKYFKTFNRKYLILSAINLALFYFVRREALFFIPLTVLFIFFKNNKFYKNLNELAIFCLVFLMIFFVNSAPFIYSIGFNQFDNVYGLNSLIPQTISNNDSSTSSIQTILWQFIQTSLFSSIYTVLSWIFLLLPLVYLFIRLVPIFVIDHYKKNVYLNTRNYLFLFSFLLVLYFVLINVTAGNTGSYDILESRNFNIYFFINILILLFIETNIECITDAAIRNATSNISILFISLQLILFTFIYIVGSESLQPSYFLVPTALMLLVTLPPLISSISKIDAMVIVFLICSIIVLVGVNIESLTTPNHERGYSHYVLNAFADTIKNLTTKNNSLFTVDTTLVINSEREIFPPITHYGVYLGVNCLSDYPSLKLPCLSDMPKILNDRNVSVIVLGFRTKAFINWDSEFADYIKNNYNESAVIIDKITNLEKGKILVRRN